MRMLEDSGVRKIKKFLYSLRLSTAIVPQLTKIEPINSLQKTQFVQIKLSDVKQYQRAVDKYVLNNSVWFDPVDFDIIDSSGQRIIQASLFPEGVSVREGKKKVFDISFSDEDAATCIAKIKHPVTGMSVYELHEMGEIISIQSNTNDMDGTRIEAENVTWLSILFACGCAFTRQSWSLVKMDVISAKISPISSFTEENSVKVEWTVCCDIEIRMVALSFGLAIMIREAFPSLLHILKEFRSRRG